MKKRIEKIVIGLDGIDVISNINGVNNVTQISLEPQENEIQEIFEKYNLEKGVIYHYDEKIIRALAVDEEGEQLRDYLEICRQVSYGAKNLEIAENMPEIEFDLRGLSTYED